MVRKEKFQSTGEATATQSVKDMIPKEEKNIKSHYFGWAGLPLKDREVCVNCGISIWECQHELCTFNKTRAGETRLKQSARNAGGRNIMKLKDIEYGLAMIEEKEEEIRMYETKLEELMVALEELKNCDQQDKADRLERELAEQEITLQKYREDRQKRDEKIAAQDKILREYEKKMFEMCDTILKLRDEAKLGGKRICVECAHVLIDAQRGLSRCGLRRHPIDGNFVLCDIERGFKPAEYAFVCGPEGLFWAWAPEKEPRYDMRSDGTSWAIKNGGAE